MKKLGILIFIAAAVAGIVLAKMFSWGAMPSVEVPKISILSKVKGSGNVITETREVSGFSAIDVGSVFQVEVKAGEDFKVVVEADDNLMPLIVTRVDGNELKITRKKRFSTKHRIKVIVSAPNIDSIDASGASRLTLSNVDNESLLIDVSGASRVEVSGKTTTLNIDMGGASRVDAANLASANVVVDGGGASRASVNANEKISVDLGGASHVSYSGNPSEVKKDTSGGSSIRQK